MTDERNGNKKDQLKTSQFFLIVQLLSVILGINSLLGTIETHFVVPDVPSAIGRVCISLLLIGGSWTIYSTRRSYYALLAVGWLCLSFQLRVGRWVWWPELPVLGILPLGVTLSENDLPVFGCYFLPIPLAIGLWALAIAMGDAQPFRWREWLDWRHDAEDSG